jgi:hypothetical protein
MALLIAERAVRDRRRGVVGWAVGLAAYVGLMASVYPSIQNSDVQTAIRSYPKELKAFFGGSQSFDFSSGSEHSRTSVSPPPASWLPRSAPRCSRC